MTTPVDRAAPALLTCVTRRDRRSGDEVVESVHRGHLVVTCDGDEVGGLGTSDALTYVRSAAKPFQATACLEALDEFGAQVPASSQVAVAWASHRGEPRHLAAVEVMLAAAGIDAESLTCPPATSPDEPSQPASRLRHNCSGKHALFALTGAALGCPRDRLLDPDGPLQQRVLGVLAELLGAAEAVAIDGCGAPAVAAPLDRLAVAFGRLAVERRFDRVRQAAVEHPWLVGGTDRLESALLGAGVVAKPGAEGVFAAGWCDHDGRGWGLAVKTEDGASRGVTAATIGLLAAAGVVPAGLWSPPPSLGGGETVGRAIASEAVEELGRRLRR